MFKIYESRFKEFKSIVMENEMLKAVVIPELGSKMASLVRKKTNREFLYQARWEKFKAPIYSDNYEKYDLSGFDEMFPTVIECPYPRYPWKGIVLPDHGEVWSIPWDYEIKDDCIHMWVYGVRMSYKLEKWLTFSKYNILKIEYRLENLSPMEMKYIWCAHILKVCSVYTKILFPKCVSHIINTETFSDRLGDFGTVHLWPITKGIDGNDIRLDEVRSQDVNKCEKFFAYQKLTEGWCAIYHKDTNEVFGLSYPVEKVPYLGLWISEGGLDGHYHLALEPATGCFDRVDTAEQWDRCSSISRRSVRDWYLNLTIDEKDNIEYIDESGIVK